MQAVISDPEFLNFVLGVVLLAAAAGAWLWRRGIAARRIAKGLRSYATGVEVTS